MGILPPSMACSPTVLLLWVSLAGAHWAEQGLYLLQTSATAQRGNRTLDVEVSAAAEARCEKVVFLRIQKTGSTSFGEFLLPHMCRAAGQACGQEEGWSHIDYVQAMKQAADGVPDGTGCAIVLLRDPVERTLSEFFMFWSIYQDKKNRVPGTYNNLVEEQWDVARSDLDLLGDILNQDDVAKAFQDYLHFTHNPSKNRQTLYLLGFNRVGCKKRLGCTDDDNSTGYGYPSDQYDWNADASTLLATAKEHLFNMKAFGLADCFSESLDSISRAVGWDPGKAFQLMQNHSNGREQKDSIVSQAAKLSASSVASNQPSRLFGNRQSHLLGERKAAGSSEHSRWTDLVSKEVADEIRSVNSVDVELVAYARQLFYQRTGHRCPFPGE